LDTGSCSIESSLSSPVEASLLRNRCVLHQEEIYWLSLTRRQSQIIYCSTYISRHTHMHPNTHVHTHVLVLSARTHTRAHKQTHTMLTPIDAYTKNNKNLSQHTRTHALTRTHLRPSSYTHASARTNTCARARTKVEHARAHAKNKHHTPKNTHCTLKQNTHSPAKFYALYAQADDVQMCVGRGGRVA
jgi:hypothetical protein